jgi:putative two-component system response regulator
MTDYRRAMNILIVDDSQIVVALLERLVQNIPASDSIAFTDPRAALSWCETHDPDLVIVDYVMPELNGLDFARRFRALEGRAETPVLMLTATADRELKVRALQMGINDFLNKPFDKVELLARVRNMLALRVSQKQIASRALHLADDVARAIREITARERETLLCLGRAAEHRDPETQQHILRVAHYAELIAQRLGRTGDECELLLLAAPMHDIGKIGIADHILRKPGALTREEFEIMKQHTLIGEQILSKSASPVLRVAAQIAVSHHEKFDGSGYPHGLERDAIPVWGRVVAVADVFDALTSARPHKRAWDVHRACQFMRESSGTHFDPECIAAFFDVLEDVLAIKTQYGDNDNMTVQLDAT